jgi:uncharacterized protein (DUF58 family)
MKRSRGRTLRILVLVGLAFFFLFTPVRVVRVISAFYMLIIAATYLYSRMTPLAVTAARTNPVSRGIKLQDIELELRVRNRTPFPVPYFSLEDERGELFTDSGSFLVSLGAFEEKHMSYIVRGQSRGDFSLGPIRAEGTGPFGFFRWKKTIDAPGTVIVYPTIHPMDLVYRRGLPAGNLRTDDRMYEDVTQFRSMREYVPGDDVKRINWKVSAKNGKLFTMEFDPTLYFPVMLILNFSRDDYPRRHRSSLMERAAELAASVPFYYAQLNQEIGFISTGNLPNESGYSSRPLKAGYEHAQGMLELISKIRPVDGHADLNELLYETGTKIQLGTKVIIVSPPLSAKQAEALIAAKRKGMNLLLLQVESQTEAVEDEDYAGVIGVVSVKRISGEVIHG